MPLPQMLQAMTTNTATRAMPQLSMQELMAVGARCRPTQMMIGPVTMGGKKRMTRLTP